MPKLNDHGLGGGGKVLGVPVYPLDTISALIEDDVNGTFQQFNGDTTATAPEDIYQQASCVVGDEMYFIGTYTNTAHCYKYNVKTKVWTRLADCLTTFDKSWAVNIGSDIYYSGEKMIYRYDITHDSHTESTAFTPYSLIKSRACTDGRDIYIFGGSATVNNRQYAYKVNISTDFSKTQLTNIPVAMYGHGCVYGEDGFIYLFGGDVNSKSAYRYNIASNVYEKLNDIPFTYAGGLIAKIDNHIYLIDSALLTTGIMYGYNIVNGSYTKLSNPEVKRDHGHAGVVDGVIYMIGGYNNTRYKNGNSMLVIKGTPINVVIQTLVKGVKCYSNGDVMVCTIKEIMGQLIVSSERTLEKINGAVVIPNDGEYVVVDSNYVTIGG